MTRWDDLTPATINQIMSEVQTGDADPEDAKRLLQLFCESSDTGVLAELMRHLRVAFGSYLDGRQSLESALGLVRKRGRPKADEAMRQATAVAVLKCRMQGISHQECLQTVSEKFRCGESIVGEAWRDEKQNALLQMQLLRASEQQSWTAEEVKRLAEIFSNEPWIDAPGKSPNKPT